MLPEWMSGADDYTPEKGGGTFAVRTIKSLGAVMSSLRVQRGHEKARAVPAWIKIILLLAGITALSIARSPLVLMGAAALLLGYLCLWPARDIASVLRPALAAAALAAVLFLPAVLVDRALMPNSLRVIAKVALSVIMVSIFNHTTQWNHITAGLRRLHVPGIIVFSIDITLRYIVMLGRLICDLLTSYTMRAVGKKRGSYGSVGGVMGVAFLRGSQLSSETYEAMRCRCFTDDYKGL